MKHNLMTTKTDSYMPITNQHSRHWRRLLCGVLGCFAMSYGLAQSAQSDGQSNNPNSDEVTALLDRHIQAMGGTEPWTNLQNVTVRAGMDIKIISYSRPLPSQAKFRADALKGVGLLLQVEASGQSSRFLHTKEGDWVYERGGIHPDVEGPPPTDAFDMAFDLLGPEIFNFDTMEDGFIQGILTYKQTGTQFTLQSRKRKVGKHKCFLLDYTHDGGQRTIYLSEQNYLIQRIETTIPFEGKFGPEPFITVIDFKDYRPVKGTVFPFIQDILVKTAYKSYLSGEFRISAINTNLDDITPERFTLEALTPE